MEEITAQTRELKWTRDSKQVVGGGKEVKKTSLEGGKRNASPAEFFLHLVCMYIYTYKRYRDGEGGYHGRITLRRACAVNTLLYIISRCTIISYIWTMHTNSGPYPGLGTTKRAVLSEWQSTYRVNCRDSRAETSCRRSRRQDNSILKPNLSLASHLNSVV